MAENFKAVSCARVITLAFSLLSIPSFGPSSMQKRRIASHLKFVSDDDNLLFKEAYGVPSRIPSNLSREETIQVLSDRGL